MPPHAGKEKIMPRNGKKSLGIQATSELLESRVLVGSSLNIQRNVRVNALPPELADLYDRRKEKVIVTRIFYPFSKWGTYKVTLADGREVPFEGERIEEFPAGSAANTALTLRRLDNAQPVGVIGAVGGGNQGHGFTDDLRRQGLQFCLWPGEHTNFTLAVQKRGSGQTMLLCEKHPSALPEGVVEYLGQANPTLIALTGIRSDDLSLAEGIVRVFSKRQTIVAFSPHAELLGRTEERLRLLTLLNKISLLQLNRAEAALLLGVPDSSDPMVMVGHIAALGPERVVITLEGEGSVAAEAPVRGKSRIFRQGGFKVKEVKDTAGAGDVHLAALLYYFCLYRGRGIAFGKALALAAYVAAKKVGHLGPSAGVPSVKKCERQFHK